MANFREPKSDSSIRRGISRRAMLRGAGFAMALPWMESLPALAGTTAGAFPQRFAVVFMGNGINGNHWWSKGSGAEMQLGRTLQPLEPLKKKINVINGLFNKPAVGLGIHPGQTGNLLSGTPLHKGAIVRAGITMDQVLAKQLDRDTAQSSIALACEQPMTGYHETGFSMEYSSHISWCSAEAPVPLELYPSLAFDSLFENRGSLRNVSILDRAKECSEALSRQVSSIDRAKLDEYLTSVREVERRVEGMRKDKARADEQLKKTGPAVLTPSVLTMERPQNGLPEDLREHTRLMCDIIALAFQTDKTRIASLLLCRDLSGLYYPFLGVRADHHSASHDDLSDAYERIANFHLSQFAYLASRLDKMQEGEGTVLDNSCLVFLSNMWAGWKHDNMKLPVVLAGGLSGTLATGRSLDYLNAGDENRKVCSLYLSIMDRMGVKLNHFGDADSPLAGL
jgi:hypothetical protein